LSFFLNVKKPQGMTSHDVVARLRKLTGLKQIGHAGTLDRMATGVLPIAVGPACRLLRFLTNDKVYLAEILLGTRTDTDDIEGTVLTESDSLPCSEELIRNILAGFVGEQKQMPPLYSAVHHGGKRLYQLARAGKVPVDIQPRKITIDNMQVLEITLPVIKLRINCSGGTYIRAIARDFGDRIGLGACLKSLVREKSGPFTLDKAWSLEDVADLAKDHKLKQACIDPAEVLSLSVVNLDQEKANRIMMGQFVFLEPSNESLVDQKHCLVKWEKSLIALCTITSDNELRPEVVIANAKSLD
jgi:tRNA pseudouridine55 synthase